MTREPPSRHLQRLTGQHLLGPASPTGLGRTETACVRSGPTSRGRGPGHAGSPSAVGLVSAPPMSAGGPAVAREWVPEWRPRYPHALSTAGPECSKSSQGVTSWFRGNPLYLSKSQGTREGTGSPSLHPHTSCAAGKAGESHTPRSGESTGGETLCAETRGLGAMWG